MPKKLSGGCACGAIRYESDADPTVMLNCHCSDCRKASGSGYAAIVIVQKSSLNLNGEARFNKLHEGSRGPPLGAIAHHAVEVPLDPFVTDRSRLVCGALAHFLYTTTCPNTK